MYGRTPNSVRIYEGGPATQTEIDIWRCLKNYSGRLANEVVRLRNGFARLFTSNEPPYFEQGVILQTWDPSAFTVEISAFRENSSQPVSADPSHTLCHNLPDQLPENERAEILKRLAEIIPEIIEMARTQRIARRTSATKTVSSEQIGRLLEPLPKDGL